MPFHPFSSEHFITLAIGFVIIGLLIVFAKRSEKSQRIITTLLAFCNLISYPFALYAWRDQPHSLDNLLPFHLCDLAAVVAGFALITRKPILLTLTYFWGLAATTQALITPALSIGPPELPFIHFFFQHFVIVAAALYIPIVLKWRPKQPWWKSPLIVLGISIGYQATALVINHFLKTNFAFASHVPHNPSLIDHLGPWPIYLFAMQGLALIFFLILALPFAPKASRYIGLAILIFSLILILFFGTRARIISNDRAGCIMNIRNAQQAVRGHQDMNNLSDGTSLNLNDIFGPSGYLPQPVCPLGGTYTFTNTIPAVGTVICKCSHADHMPTDYSTW